MKTAQDRFWDRVVMGPNGCWGWAGQITNLGYPQLTYERKQVAAHRLAYTWLVGPIPDGLELDHLCRNRGCVNPDHLEPVTRSENMRRVPRPDTCRLGHELVERTDSTKPSPRRYCKVCANSRARDRKLRERLESR